MPYRFKTSLKRTEHFNHHGADFGAASITVYETQADAFLRRPLSATCFERRRADGDIVRFDSATDEFAVLSNDGFIRTYFKPDPVIHMQPTNYDYYLIA